VATEQACMRGEPILVRSARSRALPAGPVETHLLSKQGV
jgi:hypothetical protein